MQVVSTGSPRLVLRLKKILVGRRVPRARHSAQALIKGPLYPHDLGTSPSEVQSQPDRRSPRPENALAVHDLLLPDPHPTALRRSSTSQPLPSARITSPRPVGERCSSAPSS